MERYHKDIYWPQEDSKRLSFIVDNLNQRKWVISQHSFDRIIEKSKRVNIDILKIGQYIKDLKLSVNTIFEFYKEEGAITKIVFRVPYNENHLVLVVTDFKSLVTVYYNAAQDNHITLNDAPYTKAAI